MRGITRRWLFNTFGVILVILFVLVIVFAVIIQNFYYSGIFQVLNGRSSELVNIFTESDSFVTSARYYTENFADKELMELPLKYPKEALELIDIFLRIVDFIARHVPVTGIAEYLDKYFPSSIGFMITKYTNGIVADILMWCYVGLFVCFWFYVASYFVNKRK